MKATKEKLIWAVMFKRGGNNMAAGFRVFRAGCDA